MAIPNLHDNTINEEFQITNFVSVDEAADFMSLPGIKDIVFTLEELFGALGDIFKKVLDIVKDILSIFGLDGLFSADSLKSLFDFIFSFMSENMTGFGFPANMREEMRDAYVSSCMNFNNRLSSEFGMKLPNIFTLSLLGVLMALICNGTSNAYSSLYSMFESKDIMEKSDLDSLFSSSVSKIMTFDNTNAIDLVKDVSTGPFSSSLLSSNPKFIDKSIQYINKDTVDKDTTFDDMIGIYSNLNSDFTTDTNMERYKNASKFRSLGETKDLSTVNRNSIDNPTSASELGLSTLSRLF